MLNAMAEWPHQQQFGQMAAGLSEFMGNNPGSKRQRRPSVRLGEIGDAPASFVSEPYFKRRKQLKAAYESGGAFSYQTAHARSGDVAVNSDGNSAPEVGLSLSKAAKTAKTRTLVHVAIGSFHDHNSTNGVHDAQGQRSPTDPSYSHGTRRVESHSPPQTSAQGVSGGKKAIQNPKNAIRKGRNGKRRRGGPRGLATIEKLTRSIPSIIEIDENENENENENEKASCLDDTTDPLSDDPYDADTPEGFRDFDLETSEGFRDAKELSNSHEVAPPESTTMNMALRDDMYVSNSEQLNVESVSPRKSEDNKLEVAREGSANYLLGSNGATGKQLSEPIPEVEAKLIQETQVLPSHDGNSRPTPEANGNLDEREPLSENTDEQPESVQQRGTLCAGLMNGVRGWLHGLGLGKYVEVFETHEVDTEVLPLLTLDDLREMGINAVGPRRKMFFAIQQLRKSVTAVEDSF